MRVAFDGGRLTSDAGVLMLADIERRLGIAERLARCLTDPRSPERVHHTLAEMIRFRVLLIAAGYPDANDCDALRADPAFKMAVGRLPESGRDLCSQPTMCRLENLPTVTALKRMMAAMVELFCDSFEQVPTADRARHRRHLRPGARSQELALFHAHYGEGTVKLMLGRIEKQHRSSARRPHAAASASVTSAQIAKACARTARYSLAGR